MWYIPFTKSPRKYTVTYHFSDLQEVYSGNRQIHTKCQLQYLHPPQISSGIYDVVAMSCLPYDLSGSLGVITPNKIPLMTIVTYLQNVTEAEFQTIGPLYLHAVWYLPFTNCPRKHTVTYHFSDLQEVYSGNRQIHTKCQLQFLYPPKISCGKCHCVIIHQTTKATEYTG